MCFSEYTRIHVEKDSDRAKRMKQRDLRLISYYNYIQIFSIGGVHLPTSVFY